MQLPSPPKIMGYRFATLLFLISLFVAASANRSWACSSDSPDAPAERSSCCSGKSGSDSAACSSGAGGCAENHPSQSCPDDGGGCGGCHCPGCGATCHAPAAFAQLCDANFSSLFFAASVQRQAFYFADHLPEAVYLPIWQPPQLKV